MASSSDPLVHTTITPTSISHERYCHASNYTNYSSFNIHGHRPLTVAKTDLFAVKGQSLLLPRKGMKGSNKPQPFSSHGQIFTTCGKHFPLPKDLALHSIPLHQGPIDDRRGTLF